MLYVSSGISAGQIVKSKRKDREDLLFLYVIVIYRGIGISGSETPEGRRPEGFLFQISLYRGKKLTYTPGY